MIWCRFEAGGKASFGIVEGETVTAASGVPWGEHAITKTTHRLGAVKLLPPWVPGTFYCAGVNYRSHVIRMAAKRGAEPKFPEKADIGYRSPNAIIGPGEAIVKPKDAGEEFQYEGELVAIIGKAGRHVSRDRALEHVFGWTIGNDVSERAWQRGDRTLWRAKDTDTFKPLGPWIVTGADYKRMRTIVRLNGREVENFATGDMIFDVSDFIAAMTRYVTI